MTAKRLEWSDFTWALTQIQTVIGLMNRRAGCGDVRRSATSYRKHKGGPPLHHTARPQTTLRRRGASRGRGDALPPDSSSARRPRLLFALLAAVLLLALALAGLIAVLRGAGTPGVASLPALKQLLIVPSRDHLVCENDIAWSPDGARIALVGYERACPQDSATAYAYQPSRVSIYETATGKLVSSVQPDATIIAALHLQPPIYATPDPSAPGRGDTSAQVIHYLHIGWSADGKQLALSFLVNEITSPVTSHGWTLLQTRGVLLTDLRGAAPRVLAHTLASGEPYSGAWDLSNAAYIPDTTTHASDVVAWSVSASRALPALDYRWGADSRPHAQTPLSVTSAPLAPALAPVGDPLAGAAFTV